MSTSPLHIAVIPDGNRRWAKDQGLKPWKGHENAQDAIRNIIDFCRDDPRVSVLTLWLFSTENWKRDPQEVDQLMTMLERFLQKNMSELTKKQTRFIHTGRKDRFAPSLVKLLKKAEETSAEFTNFTVNVAIDYGGKDEVVRAVNRALENGQAISNETIASHLDHPEIPDIDIVIRTSGESRTSNFCLWQTAYSEWFFLQKYFPDMKAGDIEEILQQYEQRKRRFGS